ncbi:MAG: hypothetical protein K0R83_2720 [Caulobacter sp.]|jgi:hypothetical protein|nr:hypothetical protein [Caulobacter sp.]
MRRLLAPLIAVLLAFSGGAALAHRGHATLSVVVIDPATGEMTVTHQMAAHDAEPALAIIAPDEQPSLDDDIAIEAFVAHIENHFKVNDETLFFETRSAEGDELTLVYRGRVKTPVRAVVIEADLLPQVDASTPEFQVNVRVGKVTRTLLFHPGDGAKTAMFD